MPSARDIKKKIRATSNTMKITRTMEMVATVKSKRGQDRLRATAPYSEKLAEVVRDLMASGAVSHPLLGAPVPAGAAGKDRPETSRKPGREPPSAVAVPPTLVVIVTGNRGLCGGYNSNVLQIAEAFLESERAAGRRTEVAMVGKKGTARFRFRKVPMARTIVDLSDNPTFPEVEGLAEEMIRRFLGGEIARVVVVSTRYHSASIQRPAETQLLPMALEAAPRAAAAGLASRGVEFILEPGRDQVLDALLPLEVKNAFFRLLVEARASEHIARRVAMKTATDNAEQMIRIFTTQYNRQRQAGITQQIVEVVSGADALE